MAELGALAGEETTRGFLQAYPPFSSLDEDQLRAVAAAAQVQEHKAGTIILDGVGEARDRLWVVVYGTVGLWNMPQGTGPVSLPPEPNEVIPQGGIFGYTVVLYGSTSGPRAVSLTDVQLLRIPGSVARPIFASPAGTAYLAKEVALNSRPRPEVKQLAPLIPAKASQMVRRKPTIGSPSLTIQEAAQQMTTSGSPVLVIPVQSSAGGTSYGLLTDGVIRSQIVAQGVSLSQPVGSLKLSTLSVNGDSPATDVMLDMLEKDLLYVPVVSDSGHLLGVIHARDYQSAPTSSSFQLRRRIEGASEVELIQLGNQIKTLVQTLSLQRAPVQHISAAISVLYDAMVKRAIFLTLQNSDLSGAEFSWLSLGSTARREAALSSDIDSAAVVYGQSFGSKDVEELRAAVVSFATEVHGLLSRAGLPADTNGAVAALPAFVRTEDDWREQARSWLKDPLGDDAMMKTFLTLDSRSIWGTTVPYVIHDEFSAIAQRPGRLKLYLEETLSSKARLKSVRDILAIRGNVFDIKQHGLVPVINIARWLALWANSYEVGTVARIKAACDKGYVESETASTLIESFEGLSRVRLSWQVASYEEGLPINNMINFRKLSPIDRSIVSQAVREIANVQRKLSNLAVYTDFDK